MTRPESDLPSNKPCKSAKSENGMEYASVQLRAEECVERGECDEFPVDDRAAGNVMVRDGKADTVISRAGEGDWIANAIGLRGSPSWAAVRLHDRTIGNLIRNATVRQAKIENAAPGDIDIDQPPVIYLFINSGQGTKWVAPLAIAEDGAVLAGHCSSSDGWALHDIGVTSDWKHDKYTEHYPAGYEIEYVPHDRVNEHAGLQAAFALNQASKEAQEATA